MTDSLSNSERLARLYDPSYVHRVETLNGGAPVRVCIEGRMLKDNEGTGVSIYAHTLTRCLGEAGAEALILGDGNAPKPRSRALRWLAATRRSPRTATAPVDAPDAPQVPDLFREAQVFFNLHGRSLPVAFEEPPVVMHWTYPVPLHVVGARNLYTIHDLIPLTHPELTPIPMDRHGRILDAIVERADLLVTVTEAMRAEVVARLNVDAGRVVSTWQAVEAPLQADPRLPEGLRSGRYFLFCGRVETRKNLTAIAAAHAQSGAALPLVIVGPRVPGEDLLEESLAAMPGVRRLPYLPRNELLGLLRRARALLFPTLAEGFGLPIVEAMTLGCPVLTSDRGATAEVAGSAALLIPPERTELIADAIRRLERDDALCARLRADGFARARHFTPERYARRLRALYAQALALPDDRKAAR
ncbi:glycosyltransferase family 1 protein [Sphingomonas sp. H39-1-10]|uniref:glycosyltransferase family 4 protein n=1 Tax=Sphingomonas pollutisoli TaxID=3030829 RepID=UPI0023BA0741|nr:glycosyltransferase family 1 protein [Sphingomonas pollutisoli]MDF0490493.1 glycosyltransferase family 1 protein [Sphingomonas pollutisoli]